MSGNGATPGTTPGTIPGPIPGTSHPLAVAALVKQVPLAESLALGPDGRLVRDDGALEMNPYCRRAVAQGVALARASGGTCTVFTMGPPQAEDVLREAVAWGADRGIHLCDPAFAGSDTLATARALAAVLQREGPFHLVLAGRNSTDGDTGQVGPEVAELLDLPFATGVRELVMDPEGSSLRLRLEHDDGWEEVEVGLPAVLSVAERLCDPCKVPPEGRAEVPAERLVRVTAGDLGPGPWGEPGSPTRVGAVRLMTHTRTPVVLLGDVADQVAQAVGMLADRGALREGWHRTAGVVELEEEAARSLSSGLAADGRPPDRPADVAVVLEPGRPQVAAELLGAAARLAAEVGGRVTALLPAGAGPAEDPAGEPVPAASLGPLGAHAVVVLRGVAVEEDVADALVAWAREHGPWVVLAPSTAFGREVAARAAAALGAGLVGDAVALDVVDGRLVAAKPAFSGALVADITCTSAVQMATVRPGVLPVPPPLDREAVCTERALVPRGRVRVLDRRRDDDVEVLARAPVVLGVGSGVPPDHYGELSTLAAILGAELAATRKVTDRGWAPRARQVGITGRSIAPRLYVAIGLSGKFNHMVGVRAAATVLAVNQDPDAPVFSQCDVGIVGDWRQVVPLLERALRDAARDSEVAGAVRPGPA